MGKKRSKRLLFKALAAVACAFPFAMTYWVDDSSWVGRTIAVGYFWTAATIGPAVLVCGPEKWLIAETGKLAGPKLARQRVVIAGFLRLCALFLALCSVVRLVYFCQDVSSLIAYNEADRFAARVSAARSTWLTWWAFETVSFKISDAGLSDYSLLFHPRRLKVGATYKVTALPRSKEIVIIERTQ